MRQMIAAVSPNSLRQTRWQTYEDQHLSAAESVRRSEELLNEMMKEPDYNEGVQAFVKKRVPLWKG